MGAAPALLSRRKAGVVPGPGVSGRQGEVSLILPGNYKWSENEPGLSRSGKQSSVLEDGAPGFNVLQEVNAFESYTAAGVGPVLLLHLLEVQLLIKEGDD